MSSEPEKVGNVNFGDILIRKLREECRLVAQIMTKAENGEDIINEERQVLISWLPPLGAFSDKALHKILSRSKSYDEKQVQLEIGQWKAREKNIITCKDVRDMHLCQSSCNLIERLGSDASPIILFIDEDILSGVFREIEETDHYIIFRAKNDLIFKLTDFKITDGTVYSRIELFIGANLIFPDTISLSSSKSRTQFINKYFAMRDDKELNKLDMEKCLIAIEKRIRKKVESNRKQVVKRDKKPKMTPEEEKEAMEFLRSPAIWEITISDLGKIGHVGEEKNKLLLLLVFISRMLKKPLACLIRGGSSAGKNALVNAALEFVPAESKKIITRATANALYYYPPEELEHVALVVVEKAGGQDADYSVRTMISEGKLSLSVPIKNPATGIIETKDKEIKGPMSYVETSTDPNVNDENITRMFSIYIDESEDQTKRIHAAQKREKTLEGLLERHEKTDLIRKHQNAQRLLRNLEVIIPFATAIDFPSHSLRTRRDFEKLLYLIMTIGFYRQYQKEAKYCGSIPYIEADLEDYRLAYDLCQSVLNQTIDEVTKKSRELLGIIMKMLGEWQKEDRQVELYDDKTDNYLRNIIFKRSDVRAYAKGWSDATLYAHMKELSRYELLRVVQGGKQGQTYKYTLANESLDVKQPINKLLSPQELEIRLKAVSSEEVSQKT